MRGFFGFPESLFGANGSVTAVGDVFVIRFTTTVLVHMSPMKHQSSTLYVGGRHSIQNVNVEHILQVGGNGSQVVKPPIVELGATRRSDGDVLNQLLA
jgi:hypothetical protein